MTTSAPERGSGRETRWTREAIIEKIQAWNALYGEPPRAADWNPSSARWCRQEWRVERYRAGNWPSLNAAKKQFGGSLIAAVRAAGLEPSRPGPPRRRSVDIEQGAVPLHPAVRAEVNGLRADVKELEQKLAVRARQLEAARQALARAQDAVESAKRERKPVKRQTKVATRNGAPGAALDRERRKAAEAQREAAQRLDEVREARKAATRFAARLERSEATVNTLRVERKDMRAELDSLRAELDATADKLTATRRLLAEAERRPAEVREVVSVGAAEVEAARAFRREAEQRVAAAERRERELAAMVTGEPRMLSAAEMEALRKRGPSGPAVLGAALKELAVERGRGGRQPLKAALWAVASAAIRWRDQL